MKVIQITLCNFFLVSFDQYLSNSPNFQPPVSQRKRFVPKFESLADYSDGFTLESLILQVGTCPPRLCGSCLHGHSLLVGWLIRHVPLALRAQQTLMNVQGDVEIESCLYVIHFSTEVSVFSIVCDVDGVEEDEREYCQGLSRTLIHTGIQTRSHH